MDHQIAAIEREFRIRERRKLRTVDHAREKRRFLKFQVSDRLAEIKLRGSGKTVVAMRQVYLVGIHSKNLRLCVSPLDLQREQNFLHFSAEAAVAAVQEEISGKLHGDGAGPAGDAALNDISHRGAEHAREVDAPVLFEVLVLNRGDRAVQNFGTLLVGHQDAALQREAAGKLAVIGVNFGHHVGAVGFQRANFRQVAGVNK